MVPCKRKKPVSEEAGKHPLSSEPQAKKIFDHAEPFQFKTEGNYGKQGRRPGQTEAGKHSLSGHGKRA